MHVYQEPKEAVLALVRIFGPCPASTLYRELRVLLRGKAVISLPLTWIRATKGFKQKDVLQYLEELWIAGTIVKEDQQLKAL